MVDSVYHDFDSIGEGGEILEYAPNFHRYCSFCQYIQEKVGGSLDRRRSLPPPPIG